MNNTKIKINNSKNEMTNEEYKRQMKKNEKQ